MRPLSIRVSVQFMNVSVSLPVLAGQQLGDPVAVHADAACQQLVKLLHLGCSSDGVLVALSRFWSCPIFCLPLPVAVTET